MVGMQALEALMKYVLTLGLLLSTAALIGCAEEGDVGTDATTLDNTLVGTPSTGSTADGECQAGFRIGHCPKDIALPDASGELVSLHDQRGSRVLVIGVAEY